MYSNSNDGPKVICSSLSQDTRHSKRDARPSMQPMHQNSSEVDCCCLEIRGEGIWMVDFCLQTHPILVDFGRNSGIISCVGSGKMRSDRANNEQEHRYWSYANGFGFDFGKNWARGRGELAMCSKSSSSDEMKFSVMWMFLGLDDEGLAGGR